MMMVALRLQLDDKKEGLLREITEGELPPWRRMTSRQLADKLGVSLQVLLTWRSRHQGPAPLPPRKPGLKPHKTYYRLDDIASWCSDGQLQPWEATKAWLDKHEFAVDGGNTQEAVAWWEQQLTAM